MQQIISYGLAVVLLTALTTSSAIAVDQKLKDLQCNIGQILVFNGTVWICANQQVTSRYTVSNSVTFAGGGFITVPATCFAGDSITGCTGHFDLVCDTDCDYLGAFISGNNTCTARAYNASGTTAHLTVFARCASSN